jgi:hypothetical protein
MIGKRTAKKSLNILRRRRMLLKKDDAERLTSVHRLLRDIPSFNPNAYSWSKRIIEKQSRRGWILKRKG